jgi:hypothetical protein
MDIEFSFHAKKRLVERGIKEKDIIETINFPDYTIRRGKEIESHKKLKDKTLKVVYVNKGKFIKIITIYYI